MLPILGAVPDGAIVLFSGLGENAQEEVAVGVGALAGSTILLLTVPWFAAIFAGRVNMRADGVCLYNHYPRLWPFWNKESGVEPKGTGVRDIGRYMLLTCVSYVIIQGMALFSGNFFSARQTPETTLATAELEHRPAIFVLCLSMGMFVYYIFTQVRGSKQTNEYLDARAAKVTVQAIEDKSISLTGAFNSIGKLVMVNERTGLVENQDRLNKVLKVFFREFDRDNSGYMDQDELAHLMSDLGERLDYKEMQYLKEWIDCDDDGKISLDEFMNAIPKWIRHRTARTPLSPLPLNPIASMEEVETQLSSVIATSTEGPAQMGDSEEEEEVPEDLRSDDPATEKRKILVRSFTMMITGTVLVLTFADPTVQVMQDMAKRLDISAFYISFCLAPVAANFSEVLSAYSYAQKKTRRTITVSFTTLLGAAILNNTFVLGIFMTLIVIKGLAWQFTAETLAILVVEVIIGFMSQKRVQTFNDAFIVLSLYPLSLVLVAVLTNVIGLD